MTLQHKQKRCIMTAGVPAHITRERRSCVGVGRNWGFDYRVALRAAICACRLALLLFETISAAALARLRCTVGEKVMTPGRSLIAGTLLAATPASAQRQPPPV